MARRLAFVVVVALCAVVLPGAAPPVVYTPGSDSAGDPYFPLDGNGGYDVQHYLLELTYDPDTDVLSGVATIQARATQNLSAFNLDFVGMTVDSVKVENKDAAWARDDHELTITPSKGVASKATFKVEIAYEGVPELVIDELGISGFIPTDDGAVIVGEPHVAATWYPANDHPTDKASFTFRWTVPEDVEVVGNGRLAGQKTQGGWTTWTWDATDPMATYLATATIGQLDIHAYSAKGLPYWDAIDPVLFEPPPPPPDPPTITPTDGEQMLYSQVSEPAYKRLTRTLTIPSGGATLSFDTFHDTEGGWDFLFVETRSAGGDDWTTLEEQGGRTTQDPGACPGFLEANPFLEHYLTPPAEEDEPCTPSGTSGDWWAASGDGFDWETWLFSLPNAGPDPTDLEVSITYASDQAIQFRGVTLDNLVVSTSEGSTSFEDDGDTLDGWVVGDSPLGSAPNQNSWTPITILEPPPPPPPPADNAQASFARQPEMIGFMSSVFGSYPCVTSGGILDNVEIGFALETQTRPTYSPGFFFDGPNDFVVVHELAHQWYGDSLAVERWQDIWLNEGFATYAEWLWSAREGFGTEQENFDFWFEEVFGDDNEFWDLPIGDPGPVELFNFAVYIRGAMTLQILRNEIGDADFFRLLQRWAQSQAGGNVTTDEFIALAEKISGEELDDLFDVWLFGTDRPVLDAAALRSSDSGKGKDKAPKQVRAMLERFSQEYRLANPAKLRKTGG
jgi:hypothetical protein